VDYLACSSYKWLLASHGLAVVYLSPQFREQLRPATSGWYSVQDLFGQQTPKPGAARLEAGMPNFPAIYVLRESAAYLQSAGVECIENHLRPLVRQLRDGLAALGLDLLTPPGESVASGIVSFAHPQAERIAGLLSDDGVIVWAGDGRVRASVHLYNDEPDVSRLLSALNRNAS
jgi:selenocysteine lyase/cysteine desulfurase